MPKAPPGLEHLLPDTLYARILRRVSPFHPVSQHEPLVNRLDASERLADHICFELEDLPCRPVDMTRSAVS